MNNFLIQLDGECDEKARKLLEKNGCVVVWENKWEKDMVIVESWRKGTKVRGLDNIKRLVEVDKEDLLEKELIAK